VSRRFPFVGIAKCRHCGRELPMRSGIHTYCTPACRALNQKPHRKRDPRRFRCLDCGIEGAAGMSGPLPRRCQDCKRKWDNRPERLAKKAAADRRRRKEKK
jgi:hypothetical protein